MIKVFIEVAAGSSERHRYDERTLQETGLRRAVRPYPYPYGFVLGTRTSDGDCADCYLITRAHVTPGTMVECEPFGLLEQDEDGEVDDKVLAALPAEQVENNSELLQELRDFICAVFVAYPDVRVQVGRILPREAALQYLQACGAEAAS